MDRHNWYAGRVVLDADLDETSDWILEAFEGAALDYGFLQDDVSTGNPDEKGGILRGLVVTLDAPATDLKVDVSVGAAKDGSYQRINLTTLANLTLTSYGKWAVGATSGAATISPVAINITTGQEQWASLFIKYGELTSNTKTDLTGSNVDFNIAESWQFELAVGTAAAPPATSREALDENSRVLLSDILIENPSGTHQIKTNGICGSNDELDTLGYGLDDTAALAGRRSDWIAAENPTDFPVWRSGGTQYFELREGNPRDAIWELAKKLATTTTLSGSGIVGAPAKTAVAAAAYLENKKQSVTAGSVEAQILQLLELFTDAMMQGGDNTLRPQAGFNGIDGRVADMDGDAALYVTQAAVAGTFADHRITGMKYGHVMRPHELFDDFMIIGDGSNNYPHRPTGTTTNTDHPWKSVTNDQGTIKVLNERGGVIQMFTGAGAATNDKINLCTGANSTALKWWHLGAAPWGICAVRMRIPTITNLIVRIGFWSDDPTTHGADAAYVEYAGTAANVYAYSMASGTPGAASATLGTMNTGFHTFRIAMDSTTVIRAQMDNGAWQASGASAARTGTACFGIYLETTTTAERTLDVDQVYVADGRPAADMLLA